MVYRRLQVLFVLAVAVQSAPLWSQDIVSYKDMRGVQIREYQMIMTIDTFDCEGKIGNKCRMTITVENKGNQPEVFNGTQFSIDNGKGTSYRAIPPEGQSSATLKKELQPGDSAHFTILFDGRIHFDRHDPGHLRYANTSKLRIVG
jgi:hypothetical protein